MFEHGARVGYKFSVLDIGGGFPGADKMELFREEVAVIHQSLDRYFNRRKFPELKVIAEPGKYIPVWYSSEAGVHAHLSPRTVLHCHLGCPCCQYF